MPIHDWTTVDAGIFHAFHHQWISTISEALNGGLLPRDYYALPEQHLGALEPDVLTLELTGDGSASATGTAAPDGAGTPADAGGASGTALLVAPPTLAPTAETAADFYRRKQNSVVIRHVTGDRMVAVIEIVSPGNKSSVARLRKFIEKASSLLLSDVHLLILDVFPPGRRDPNGIHGAIWDDVAGGSYRLPADQPLTIAAYEASAGVRAFVRHASVGEPVSAEVPLFLKPNACVIPPLDATYQAAFARMPARWRQVLEAR